MYNAEMKQRFVEEFSTSATRKRSAVYLFNRLEPFEEEWGADICTKTARDIKPLLGEILGARASSVNSLLSILKNYVKWCCNNRYPGATKDIVSLSGDPVLDKFKQQTVSGPQHLQRYLDYMFDEESEESVDNIYRCFLWLAFMGVKENDVLEIEKTDVIFSEMIVRHGGNEYQIYRESVPSLKNCVNLTRFHYVNPCYKAETVAYRKRNVSNLLLAGTGKDSMIKFDQRVYKQMKNPKNKEKFSRDDGVTKLRLSFKRVWTSGLFYRCYELERAGVPVDYDRMASAFMEGRVYGEDAYQATKNSIKRNLASDYARWKKIYSI